MSRKKPRKTPKHKQSTDSEVETTEEIVELTLDEASDGKAAGDVPVTSDSVSELEELKQRFQRLAADYQNYQKRSSRHVAEAGQFARENMVKSLLPVLDNFEHVLEKGGAAPDIVGLLQGIQIVYDHLLDVLEGVGMHRIQIAMGCSFDPAQHEAMMHEETDQVSANGVIRELARGYIMNERTLRPAKVSVAKPPSPKESPEQEEGQGENPDQPVELEDEDGRLNDEDKDGGGGDE